MNSYQKFALSEFTRMGWIVDGEYTDKIQQRICGEVMQLLGVFSEDHSGASAADVITMFNKLTRMSPLDQR
jgi:hypothetical protein